MSEREFVLLESPFAGDVERHVKYARRAMRDSLDRGEAPFASHLLYTQMLNDGIEKERQMGIEAGLAIGKFATKTVVYTDFGVSRGMQYGIDRAEAEGRSLEFRQIYTPKEEWK